MAQLPMLRKHSVIAMTGMAVVCLLEGPRAQPIPVTYAVRLASATVYDTRSRDEDTVHASLWDGKGWDGSRNEGRVWVTGLHLFGTPTESNVQVSTGRIQDSDNVQVVFEILNAHGAPSSANYEAAAAQIQQ